MSVLVPKDKSTRGGVMKVQRGAEAMYKAW